MCMRSCADQINGVVDDGAATPKKCLRLDYSDVSSYKLCVFCGTTGSLLVPKGFTFVLLFRTNVRTPSCFFFLGGGHLFSQGYTVCLNSKIA